MSIMNVVWRVTGLFKNCSRLINRQPRKLKVLVHNTSIYFQMAITKDAQTARRENTRKSIKIDITTVSLAEGGFVDK